MSQEQKVGEGARAAQAGRDLTVVEGYGPQQMAEIMITLAGHLSNFTAKADQIVKERLEHFREDMLREFAKQNGGNPAAFGDPDFQYVLGQAQEAFVRTDDKELGENLINMISERSRRATRDRITLSLNSALAVASELTAEDFSVLSLVFCVTRAKATGALNDQVLVTHADRYIFPFMKEVRSDTASAAYLESKGCCTLGLQSVVPSSLITHAYPGLFSNGFSQAELETAVPSNEAQIAVIPCLNDSSRLQFAYSDTDLMEQASNAAKISADRIEKAKALFNRTKMPDQQAQSKLYELDDRFKSLDLLFQSSDLRAMRLTTSGITIAHANIKRVIPEMTASLDIWIN